MLPGRRLIHKNMDLICCESTQSTSRAFASSAGIVEAGHKDVAAKRRFKFYMAYAWGIPVLIGES